MADLPCGGWSNKKGTSSRNCVCGSWKQHWINISKKQWPSTCSVSGCGNKPDVGAHVINAEVNGEKIIPMCDSCNKLAGTFRLKGGVSIVSANTSETCEK